MFEETISIWASMNSWFTPSVLFVLLNLMIGTIVLTHKQNQQNQQQIRKEEKKTHLKSNISQEPTADTQTPDENEEAHVPIHENNIVTRSKSDVSPSGAEIVEKLPAKMKSASEKSAFDHFTENDVVLSSRGEDEVVEHFGDDEVDAKADDFIYKFKQQLKLQGIGSFARYGEMIHSNNNM
ncbi:protein of unknown function DUF4408 [Dillenia turbinata]|uniref:DUF4408 domain-containing protein n=1 Tax=Dillenia turbinata TaxID=194707 RepID=A0AAN8YUB9_9MAGN